MWCFLPVFVTCGSFLSVVIVTCDFLPTGGDSYV